MIVVDILRFSTTAVVALQRDTVIYACAPTDDVALLARRVGAAYRRDMLATYPYSLSPASYDRVPPGTRIVLPCPNRAVCSRYGREAPYLFVGALLNAAAVAEPQF